MHSSPPATRPRFSLTWGAGVSLIGFLAATLLGAVVLQVAFGLLLGVLGLVLGLRWLGRRRERLLWRLRHRLLAAYVLIGLIPLVLLLLIGLLGAWTLYGKVAVYLATDHLGEVQAELQDAASDLATALEVAGTLDGRLRPERVRGLVEAHRAAARQRYPAAEVHLLGASLPGEPALPGWLRNQKLSAVVMGKEAELVCARPFRVGREGVTVVFLLPLEVSLLPALGREVGRVSLALTGEGSGPAPADRVQIRVGETPQRGVRVRLGEREYPVLRYIADPRPLPPSMAWWDITTVSIASQPTFLKDTGQPGPPLLLHVESRVALIHRQLAYRLGEFSGLAFQILALVAILFLAMEIAAVWTGVKLARSITATVNDLQTATEQVQAGNFSHRFRIRGRDQLSGLAEAFNSMTASLERLIEESKEKQRLQNELEIARQVQEELFPREAPRLETLELVGRCRPARTVSGDYYDFGLAEPGKLILTIGDISGKGISAALLMATIQSALRSQVYASRLEGGLARLSMAELVARVNRQLCATTSMEKYSTLFLAHYDDATRQLTYTNAGHLPPVRLRRGRSELLSVGGPVVGVLRDVTYEQATVALQPGDWLVAYTDGLTEVTNSYEEEYGSQRLVAFLERSADSANPEALVEAMLGEVQQWAPGVEPSDDCTVLAARVR